MEIMIKFEIKKIFLKTINKLALLLLVLLILVGAFLTVKDVTYVNENGQTLSGLSASKYLRNEKNEWKGDLDSKILSEIIDKNNKINAAQSDEDKAFIEKQGMEDILQIINESLAGFGEYDYYGVDNIDSNTVSDIYEQRIQTLKDYLNTSDNFTKNEKEYLIEQYQNLNTPLYYEYADGWKALLGSQFLPTLMIIITVVLGFLVSGIFSDEFIYKADSIFFSTRFGRNKAILSKIAAGLITTTSMYWCSVILYSLLVLTILGFDGAECMIQTSFGNWFSMYNITYLQEWFLTMFGGYIGLLFILILAMLVSAKTRSTVFAITIPFALSCAPMFLGRIEILSRAMTLFPDMLLRISTNLGEFVLYELGGYVIDILGILIPLYSILSILLLPILFYVYRKTEIR